MKNKMPNKIGLAVLIFVIALGPTYVTRVALPGAETSVHESCAIEDCRAEVKPAGLPFRAYEISRFEGINCNAQMAMMVARPQH